MQTALAIVVIFDALAWSLGVLPVLRYAQTHRSLPSVYGIRLLGGPMEAFGIEAVIVTGIMFVIVNGLKLLAAYWLWHGRVDGAILQLILLGLSAIFWFAFALPFGPLLGLLQVVLIALAWQKLS
ncbi:membrane protein of unknown function [Candidatus Promineifilum breve]|uniref:Uncharacterized protein n=1 Tax=Candidatus Promineifilum breve TaxID=1806508 RepID=A0A160SZW0_9CHLR|nr:hypothetical protein [Candidatus Promineifilum breve]CUS02986.2 membrane protein of unknown function [Candidatus Promineifilum breve]